MKEPSEHTEFLYHRFAAFSKLGTLLSWRNCKDPCQAIIGNEVEVSELERTHEDENTSDPDSIECADETEQFQGDRSIARDRPRRQLRSPRRYREDSMLAFLTFQELIITQMRKRRRRSKRQFKVLRSQCGSMQFEKKCRAS